MPNQCPICERRRAKRFCPGLPSSRWSASGGTSICPQCCGEQREVSIDCPADCSYLIAAHRYEGERRQPPKELAFEKVAIERDFLAEHGELINGLSVFLARFAQEHTDVCDADLLAVLDALARSYQTLDSGLYYEQPPESAPARRLYAAAKDYLKEFEGQQQQRTGSSVRPVEVLRAVVFLRRLGQWEANGRARSRRYLTLLRGQLPPEDAAPAPAESPLIIPGR